MLSRSTTNPAVTRFTSAAVAGCDGRPLRAFLLKPVTGRTHQLRVAMKSLGAPVLGDEVRAAVRGGRCSKMHQLVGGCARLCGWLPSLLLMRAILQQSYWHSLALFPWDCLYWALLHVLGVAACRNAGIMLVVKAPCPCLLNKASLRHVFKTLLARVVDACFLHISLHTPSSAEVRSSRCGSTGGPSLPPLCGHAVQFGRPAGAGGVPA